WRFAPDALCARWPALGDELAVGGGQGCPRAPRADAWRVMRSGRRCETSRRSEAVKVPLSHLRDSDWRAISSHSARLARRALALGARRVMRPGVSSALADSARPSRPRGEPPTR